MRLERIPVLASLVGAGDSIGIGPACYIVALLDNAVPLSAESGGQHLMVECEGFHNQRVHIPAQLVSKEIGAVGVAGEGDMVNPKERFSA